MLPPAPRVAPPVSREPFVQLRRPVRVVEPNSDAAVGVDGGGRGAERNERRRVDHGGPERSLPPASRPEDDSNDYSSRVNGMEVEVDTRTITTAGTNNGYSSPLHIEGVQLQQDASSQTTVTEDVTPVPAVEVAAAEQSSEDLFKLKVPELKAMLRERGLKVSGKKAELVERLLGSTPFRAPKEEASTETATWPSSFPEAQESSRGGGGSAPTIKFEESSVASRLAPGTGEDLLVAGPPDDTNGGYFVDPREDSAWSGGEERWRTRTEDVTQPFSTLPVVRHRGIDRLPIMPTPLGDSVEGVQIVAGRERAREVVRVLMDNPHVFFACDTEVAEIDLKEVGPIGNGRVTCISIYGGPDLDCGEGAGKILWVDNMGAAEGTLEEFKVFFESERHKKVWHNYGFDRHVMFNKPDRRDDQRIDCKGFGGDTMHMARLWDTSMEKRAGEGGFSLEALSLKLLGQKFRKTPMKELFGVAKLKKDGTPGNVFVLPPIDEIQTNPEVRQEFIAYSAYDAQATWLVHQALTRKLKEMPWKDDLSMLDFYEMYYIPFGELLTDMERTGIYVEAKGYLKDVEVQARLDKKRDEEKFLAWATSLQPGVAGINPSSSTQIQTFLFGGALNAKTNTPIPETRVFKVERDEAEVLAEMKDDVVDEYTNYTAEMLKDKLKTMGLKTTGKKADLLARVRGEEAPEVGAEFKVMTAEDLKHACQARGLNGDGNKADLVKKLTDDTVMQLQLQNEYREAGKGKDDTAGTEAGSTPKLGKYRDLVIGTLGLIPMKFTKAGAPAVSIDVLKDLAGDPYDNPPRYGRAYKSFGGGREGREACEALYALCNMGSVDTMVSNFLQPLQELADENSRVHCSLNLNTETGRLSSRKPNLQNQPALEKDQYKIRAAFRAEEGKALVVADYGQLELRLLAHISECKSMIDAFKSGGCFHSRTAVGMFDYIREAVDKGEVLLEWDYSKGAPPKPLVKDVYGSERRKAKTLNFSIAYGKTAHGLSKDWGVSVKEAEGLVEAWYADRPEVKAWQQRAIANAKRSGFSRTLMGRYRTLPDINSRDRSMVSHSKRAAINTPIQGGAADVAMVAMMKLHQSPVLKDMGWKLLLQIHDEVILEGPEATAKEALAETVRCMEHPWDGVGLKELRVSLAVDANSAKTWYEAK